MLRISLILALTLTTSIANGEQITYSFLNMSDAKPYSEIPCPESCGVLLNIGLSAISGVLGSILNNIEFPTNLCQQCIVGGFYDFTYTHTCFMSPGKDVFDHILQVVFPHFSTSCECEFSNSASEAAKKINEGEIIKGHCGKENYENKETCKPMECKGSQAGESHVKLLSNLKNAVLDIAIRIDTNKNPVSEKPTAFPLYTSLTVDKGSDPFTHEAPEEFKEAWGCLSSNWEGLLCHMYSGLSSPFYDCMNPDKTESIIHTLLILFGKC